MIEKQTLWGQTVFRIWLPASDAIVKIPGSALNPIREEINPENERHRISYIATAAKVADLLEGSINVRNEHLLLAPMESNVIPLPHQITALSRTMSGDRVRYLLADEVGLGKTIEAGLVLRELKLRGLARRILIVAPKGIVTQWVSEMQTHFNEKFQLILGEDLKTLGKVSSGESSTPWTIFDQIVVSIDSVKPMEKRRGWPKERIAEYNKIRFEDLITAGWDLVIVDESHRLGGSTDQIARYKLGQGLAESAPYLLLLTATPHQGKTDAFHRLMKLLDTETFPDIESVSRDRVAPYVIRTEKRKAVDAEGQPLFKPRRTEMSPVSWQQHHHLQELLYKSVTDYVREGYNQAIKDKNYHIGFLMILMQRLVVSSTRAIRTTLERRLEALKNQTQLIIEKLDNYESLDSELESIYDMDGQELLDELLEFHVAALENEVNLVESILNSAVQCEQAGPDAKAEYLIDWIYRLQSEENESDLKTLIFTEFVSTQAMLKEFLEARGISVVCLNGSLSMEERIQVQESFRTKTRVLISTDAGGEGLNLQFCHIVINYDIPWNPMRLEQRIGRVDRIGQRKTVRAINFVFENSVELRVREVLEQKLSVIFHEYGIDKTGDVLDSAQAGGIFEEMFTAAILNPDNIDDVTQKTVDQIKQEIRDVRERSAIYGISDEPDLHAAERLRSHPLPHWLEQMTISYLESHGGKASRKKSWWNLLWPDGAKHTKAVFNSRDADIFNAKLLNLENPRIRGLALNIPPIAAGQPIPNVQVKDLPENIAGYWGLYEIRITLSNLQIPSSLRTPHARRRFLTVFTNEEGKVFLPTARHIWNGINDSELSVTGTLSMDDSKHAFERLREVAEETGKDIFSELMQEHSTALDKESERAEYAFEYRRKSIEKLGLAEVKNYRNKKLDEEISTCQRDIKLARNVIPDLRPLLIMKVGKGAKDE
ncbi:superfamily II DNA/RNA helicase, SNF2 family [Candidatus Scalindua japonica]|uniref:Superfamily II DNA/RNA helicase, SNF2 family n=1 Tax=Candidatus Scalindua japonica TaxID=1284222 RepID=A0A286U0Q6_9BACT|nr:helicase-related protein [Candidatus Scalindua japonica]GAX61717.1 superfamily II DNA/RNA helicase, SNF2 family [Candidatus Scalindua japonica]